MAVSNLLANTFVHQLRAVSTNIWLEPNLASLCKLFPFDSLVVCHENSHAFCGCRASEDYRTSSCPSVKHTVMYFMMNQVHQSCPEEHGMEHHQVSLLRIPPRIPCSLVLGRTVHDQSSPMTVFGFWNIKGLKNTWTVPDIPLVLRSSSSLVCTLWLFSR